MGETENQNIVVIGGEEEVNQEAETVAGIPAEQANLITGSRSTRKTQWNEEMKTVIVECYTEARKSNSVRFLQRMKKNWDERMPGYSHISKGTLASNSRRFSIETGKRVVQKAKFRWEVEHNVKLVELIQETKNDGCGYMDRLYTKWCKEYPQLQWMSKQLLRDNASRFEKEEEVQQLMLVRQRQDKTAEVDNNKQVIQELFGESSDEGLWFEEFSDVSSMEESLNEKVEMSDSDEDVAGEEEANNDENKEGDLEVRTLDADEPQDEDAVEDDIIELNRELLQETERKYGELQAEETVDRPKLTKLRLNNKQMLDLNIMLKHKLRGTEEL